MLNTGHFVTRRTVVFRNLCLNDDLWIKLARNYEVRGLVETLDALSTLRLAETNSSLGQDFFDGRLKAVADQFTH